MTPVRKPIAFVTPTGYVIPYIDVGAESSRHIKGRAIYTERELDIAIETMNRLQHERRQLADEGFGADAQRQILDIDGHNTIEDAITNLEGERETVPSYTASPKRARKTGGPSQKLTQPNIVEQPATLHVEAETVEPGEQVGLIATDSITAMFGGQPQG